MQHTADNSSNDCLGEQKPARNTSAASEPSFSPLDLLQSNLILREEGKRRIYSPRTRLSEEERIQRIKESKRLSKLRILSTVEGREKHRISTVKYQQRKKLLRNLQRPTHPGPPADDGPLDLPSIGLERDAQINSTLSDYRSDTSNTSLDLSKNFKFTLPEEGKGRIYSPRTFLSEEERRRRIKESKRLSKLRILSTVEGREKRRISRVKYRQRKKLLRNLQRRIQTEQLANERTTDIGLEGHAQTDSTLSDHQSETSNISADLSKNFKLTLPEEMSFLWAPENKRTQISPERMKSAVLQVVLQGKSIRAASKDHHIDRKTLGRYVQKYRNTKDEEIELKPNYSSAQIFTDAEESLLESYLTLAAEIHNGLTSKVARQIAYEHGIAHKKILPDNWYATKCASYDWLRGFLHRHRSFSLKNPNAPSYNVNDFKPKNKFIAEVFESARLHESKFLRDKSTPLEFRNTQCSESGVSNAYDSEFVPEDGESGISSEPGEKSISGELHTVHDPDCLLNTTGSSNFTPFCTCQYKIEKHKSISITTINSVPDPETITNTNGVPDSEAITTVNGVYDPEDIYILPTTDEPEVAGSASVVPEVAGLFSETKLIGSDDTRKFENSTESSDYPVGEESVIKEQEFKESKRTKRKRKL